MDNHRIILTIFFTVYTAALKFLGFNIFKYPSNSFKFSFVGIIFLILSLVYSTFQCAGVFSLLRYSDKDVSDAVQKTGNILSWALAFTLISTFFNRIVLLLSNCGLCKRLYHVIHSIENLDFLVRNENLTLLLILNGDL